MTEEKPERVVTVDTPGMTNVVTKEYFILPFTDIAINRDFFTLWTPLVFFMGVAVTTIALLTDWWQTLIVITLTSMFITHPYVGFPLIFVFMVYLYFRHRRNSKKKAKQVYLGGR